MGWQYWLLWAIVTPPSVNTTKLLPSVNTTKRLPSENTTELLPSVNTTELLPSVNTTEHTTISKHYWTYYHQKTPLNYHHQQTLLNILPSVNTTETTTINKHYWKEYHYPTILQPSNLGNLALSLSFPSLSPYLNFSFSSYPLYIHTFLPITPSPPSIHSLTLTYPPLSHSPSFSLPFLLFLSLSLSLSLL